MAGRGKLALRRRAKRRLVARVPGSGVLAIVRAGSDMGVTGRYRQRALSALKWSVSGDVAEQVIRAGYAIVLARLLSPREFGLVAMVTVITQFVISIADLGFEEALVQWPDVSEAHRSSVFWLTLVVGAGLAVALFAGAQSIAAFYGVQEVAPLAALLSALFVLTAAGTVPRAIVTRQLDFQSVAWLQCVTAVLACTCAVTLAWRGFGALSLAADLLLTEALETLLYFAASAWRPRLACRFAALRELFSFSGYRVAGRTVTFSTQLDRLLIGKFLGSGALGLYGRAYNLTRIPLLYATRSISKVMFPSLVQIQGDVHRVGDVYLRTVGGVALLTFPMCMGLFAAAEPLIVGILGPQWREAVPITDPRPLRRRSESDPAGQHRLLVAGACRSSAAPDRAAEGVNDRRHCAVPALGRTWRCDRLQPRDRAQRVANPLPRRPARWAAHERCPRARLAGVRGQHGDGGDGARGGCLGSCTSPTPAGTCTRCRHRRAGVLAGGLAVARARVSRRARRVAPPPCQGGRSVGAVGYAPAQSRRRCSASISSAMRAIYARYHSSAAMRGLE